ncbi:MAG: ATP-binding protein [Anaerolineae bacterium]
MKLLLGKDVQSEEPVYLDAEGARAVLVCGKRGSGKSYTLGVLVEELLSTGGENIIPIIVDPMGVYHTMTQANTAQQDVLFKWGLSTKGYDVRLLVPGDPGLLYDDDILQVLAQRGVNIIPLRLNPSDLTPDGWCDLFDANINRPLGIVLFRAVQRLQEKESLFSIPDIIRMVERDGKAQDTSKEALLNRLEAARSWQLFAEDGYSPMQELFVPGTVNVVDLSRLEPGTRGRRNLTISVIARNLFRARSDARLREEFGLAAPLPRVWMLIDEAHQFVPNGSTTLTKEQLVRWAKEGRQPGLSLVVASQQPSAIDPDVLSQCDVILSHKLTTRDDISALNSLSQDYMGGELRTFIKSLKRIGEAVLVDDERETVHMLRIRPRRSQHGGSSIPAQEEEAFDIWQQ